MTRAPGRCQLDRSRRGGNSNARLVIERAAPSSASATPILPGLRPQRPDAGYPGFARRHRRRRPDAFGYRRHRALRRRPGTAQRPGRGAGPPDLTLLVRVRPRRRGAMRHGGPGGGAILSGQATTVLVFRALNGRSGRRYGLAATGDERSVGGNGHLRRVLQLPTAFSPPARSSPSWPSATCSSTARRRRSLADRGHVPGPGPQPCRPDARRPLASMTTSRSHDLPPRSGCSTSAWRPMELPRWLSPRPGGPPTAGSRRRSSVPWPRAAGRRPSRGSISRAHARVHHHPAARRWPTPCTDAPASGPATSTSPSSTTASRSRVLMQLEDYGFADGARAVPSRPAAPSTSAARSRNTGAATCRRATSTA